MTRAIVICNLYKRKEKPSVNAEKAGYYTSGDEIEIVDVVLGETPDDYYEGTPTWYKLNNGFYVWSGGVSLNLEERVFRKKLELDSKLEITSDFKNLNSFLNFSFIPDGNGKNIRVAILDSGIREIDSISINRELSKDFINRGSIHPHGSWIAGIIGTRSNELIGLAPDSEIVDLRVANSTGNTEDKRLLLALDYIFELNSSTHTKCHIVNISLDILSDSIDVFQQKIEKILNQGTLVVVAGNNRFGKKTNITKGGKLIGVGVFEQIEFETKKVSGFDPDIFCSFQNQNIPSVEIPEGNSIGDSSGYTALFSGYIAKMLSSNLLATNVRSLLKDELSSISSEPNLQVYKPYKS